MRPDDRLLEQVAAAIAEGRELEVSGQVAAEHAALLEALSKIARVEQAHRCLHEDPEQDVERWGDLFLIRKLAEGAHGTVYEALDLHLDRMVALKLISPQAQRQHRDPAAIAREGKLLARVKHPNVATVYGAERHEGRVGVWMELIRGRTLAEIVEQEAPFGAREATLIGIDLARATAAIHAQGFLHRDIKAANVMREQGGRIVLMDLGIGQEVGAAAVDRNVVGTPLYMAPEVLAGRPPSVRSEVYSLGVLLFFLVTGRYPIVGETVEQLRAAHERGDRTLLRDLRPELPHGFVQLVQRAIAHEPERRFATMGEFERALLGFLGSEGALAGDVSFEVAPAPDPVRARAWRRPGRQVIAVGAALLVLAASAWWWWNGSGDGIPAGSQVVLGEIENLTGQSELSAVGDVLRGQLETSPHFRLISQAQLWDVLERMRLGESALSSPKVAREAAWREVAAAVVYGSLVRIGSRYRLTITLEHVGREADEPVRRVTQAFNSADATGVLDAIDGAARWLRRQLGEGGRSEAIAELSARQATSGSWQAIDLYSRHFALVPTDWSGAIELLQQAVQIDPEFALARARLGSLYAWIDLGAAYREWSAALALRRQLRLNTREGMQIEADTALGGLDPTRALEVYREWAELYPYDYFPRFGQAYSLRELGRDHEAIDRLVAALSAFPDEPLTYARLAELYVDTGQLDRAQRALEQLRDRWGREPGWAAAADYYEGRLRFVRRQYDAARDVFVRLTDSRNEHWRSRGYGILAALAGERGDLTGARARLRDGLAFDSGRPSLRALAARKHLALAYLALEHGDSVSARAQARRALASTSDPRLVARAATFLARAGAVDEAEQVLDRVLDLQVPLFQVARARIAGEVALARGDTTEARRRLTRASDLDLPTGEREYLAHAAVAMGETQFAFELYRRIAADPARLIRADTVWEAMPGFWADCAEQLLPLADALGLREQVAEIADRLGELRSGSTNVVTGAARGGMSIDRR